MFSKTDKTETKSPPKKRNPQQKKIPKRHQTKKTKQKQKPKSILTYVCSHAIKTLLVASEMPSQSETKATGRDRKKYLFSHDWKLSLSRTQSCNGGKNSNTRLCYLKTQNPNPSFDDLKEKWAFVQESAISDFVHLGPNFLIPTSTTGTLAQMTQLLHTCLHEITFSKRKKERKKLLEEIKTLKSFLLLKFLFFPYFF